MKTRKSSAQALKKNKLWGLVTVIGLSLFVLTACNPQPEDEENTDQEPIEQTDSTDTDVIPVADDSLELTDSLALEVLDTASMDEATE